MDRFKVTFPSDISVKLFRNRAVGLRKDVVERVCFLFLALTAVLFSGAKPS